MNDLLSIARQYTAGLGLGVIPIRPDDRKRPALAAWKPYQERRANDDELAGWFGRAVDRGIAAVCGQVSGCLVVVDIDDTGLAETVLKANTGLLESTLCVRTGGGNLHVYVRAQRPPLKFSLRRGDAPLPVDVQGEGGYVVMPPSKHASGRLYEWFPGCGQNILVVTAFDPWFSRLLARAGIDWCPQARRPAAPSVAEIDPWAVGEVLRILRGISGEAGEERGGEVWFRCLFHHDEVPSLSANSDRPVWHCFGCGEGGGLGRLRVLLQEAVAL